MNVYELVDRYNGEIVCNAARVRVEGTWVEVGRMSGAELVFTDAGRALAERDSPFLSPTPAEVAAPKKRGRKPVVDEVEE